MVQRFMDKYIQLWTNIYSKIYVQTGAIWYLENGVEYGSKIYGQIYTDRGFTGNLYGGHEYYLKQKIGSYSRKAIVGARDESELYHPYIENPNIYIKQGNDVYLLQRGFNWGKFENYENVTTE
eukprot:102838_1